MPKPWRSRPPQGSAIDLPVVRELARGPDPGLAPRVHERDGRIYVHYRRTRLYLDREAWEALSDPADVLVQRIAPRDAEPFTIALTLAELTRYFGEVRQTRSWDEVRCYHFPQLPPAVSSFVVGALPVGQARASRRRVVRRRGSTEVTVPDRRGPPAPSSEHAWASRWADRTGGVTESADYLASVKAWREAWRPDRVRVLLLAESHVGQEPGDQRIRVRVPEARELPTSFCRLVYCLGYGESDLCHPAPARNSGTWQYWDILGAIAGGARPEQPRKRDSDLMERLAWKLEVLRWLRAHGVWLLDACVAGVYRSGGGRAVAGKLYDEMVRESFERFVWPAVHEDSIEQVWIIGAQVRRALKGRPELESARAIVQPQGDRHEPGRHARELAELVASVRRVVPGRT